MNCHIESEQFDIKHEENSLSVTAIKTEPQDVKCEVKAEAGECDEFAQQVDVKSEISLLDSYVKTASEVEGAEQDLGNWLDDKNLQEAQKNADKSETSIVPILHNPSETCRKDLQENKCDHIADMANLCGVCTETEDKEITCNICNECFHDKDSYTTHLHSHKTLSNNFSRNLFSENVENTSDRIIYTNEKTYTLHIDKCRPTRHSGNIPIKDQRFTCNICSKMFSFRSKLIIHKRTHSNEKPFTCDYCNKSFSRKSNLCHHVGLHRNEKPFTCSFCSKSFPHKSDLVRHKLIHSNVKPFTCNYCNKSFTQDTKLIVHLRSHTKEKPYKCEICKKSFSHKSNLNRHIRNHTSEKSFVCEFCNKLFCYNLDLMKHVRTHTNGKPFACDFCSKSFCKRSDVIRHTRIHTNEKPFKCDYCCKLFSFKCILKQHIRIHT